MIRLYKGGKNSVHDWINLRDILYEGLQNVCSNDCDSCQYKRVCKEVSRAITYCDKQINNILYKKGEA